MEEVKEKSKIGMYILMVVIALLSAVATYVLMTYVFKKEEVEKEKEEVSINDPIVQKLYGYVKLDSEDVLDLLGAEDLWLSALELNLNQTSLTESGSVSNLDPYIKNELGYKYMSTDGISTIKCTNDINLLIVGENTNELKCGELDYDNSDNVIHTDYSKKVIESYLKQSVENLFGPNSYTAFDFGTYFSSYQYYEPEKAYVYFEGIGSITREAMRTSLESVANTDNTLTLTIKLYQEETETQDAAEHGTYKLLYKISNNNYYLYSIEKVV